MNISHIEHAISEVTTTANVASWEVPLGFRRFRRRRRRRRFAKPPTRFTMFEDKIPYLRTLARAAKTRPHSMVPSRARKAVATGKAYYKGIRANFICDFETIAVTTRGRRAWQQRIQLVDLPDELKTHDKLIDAVRASLAGDIRVDCNCPAHLYWGYRYLRTRAKSAIEPEHRPPNIRNPKREGSVCKHLFAILQSAAFFASEIVQDLRGRNRLNAEARAAIKDFEDKRKGKGEKEEGK